MDFQASPIVRAIQSVLFQVLSLFLLSFIFPFPFLTSTLQGQNQNPVAINDTVDYQSFSQINIDVLANDINPTGEPVEIFDFQNFYPDSITPDGKIYYCNSLWNMDHLSKEFEYRIRLVNHPEYASDWARVVVNYLPDSSFFFARKDSARVFMHKPTRINLLKNDYFVNPQDTIVLINPVVLGSWYGKILEKDDSTVTYQADPYGQNDEVEIIYTLRQKGAQLPTLSSVQVAHVICLEEPFAFLDLNNIKARINPFGNLFNTFTTPSRGFFVPKNSTQSPVFISSLWFGGLDEQELLHFAGEQYRISGYSGSMRAVEDFWAGPVSDTTQYDPVYDSLWNRVWKFEGWEVEHHKHHWTEQGYWPPDNIRTWPAHGNPSLGEAENLAPFFDNNGDGVYNAFDGDYPDLYGHQCIFFLFNDFIKPNRESKGKRLGVEIHGWAYAFNLPGDSAFWNTIFFHYDIYNHSSNIYHNMYIGNFTDLDIGWAHDDFMMCDVERNMVIGYNADSVDGEGQTEAYGDFPPAQGVILLGGPFMDPDGMDNPRVDSFGRQLCDESVNGTHFGDGVADNERLGMQHYLWQDPDMYHYGEHKAEEMYHFLCGRWPDGEPLIYGGNGSPSTGGYGPQCAFMFPGLSDSLNWGVGCQLPNGPVNWTQESVGNYSHDDRGMMSAGPFTFRPGDKQELDIAFTFARDYHGNQYSSVDLLRQYADLIRASYGTNTLPNGDPFFGVEELPAKINLNVILFPNPASSVIYLKFPEERDQTATIQIMTIQGKPVLTAQATSQGTASVNIASLPNGFYFVMITLEGQTIIKKLVKR
ncbi:MAG: T9SS type A sorting domain-containing protein [Bacteroidales bacterium]|nr:T9SS type A sorting domain-containing protein [Bacteroidales bacterium]